MFYKSSGGQETLTTTSSTSGIERGDGSCYNILYNILCNLLSRPLVNTVKQKLEKIVKNGQNVD